MSNHLTFFGCLHAGWDLSALRECVELWKFCCSNTRGWNTELDKYSQGSCLIQKSSRWWIRKELSINLIKSKRNLSGFCSLLCVGVQWDRSRIQVVECKEDLAEILISWCCFAWGWETENHIWVYRGLGYKFLAAKWRRCLDNICTGMHLWTKLAQFTLVCNPS